MDSGITNVCLHCRAAGIRHLGVCAVCRHSACDKCGNVQFVQGERRVAHNECLKRDDGAFKMIKFIRP